jgi:hypothetical protein
MKKSKIYPTDGEKSWKMRANILIHYAYIIYTLFLSYVKKNMWIIQCI